MEPASHPSRPASARLGLVAAAAAAAALAVTACGSPSTGSTGSGPLDVVVSFYPLQYAVERIGGDAVSVTDLTKPGAEPHDLELTPKDVAAVSDADLVVYLSGFQSAVDSAATAEAGDRALDVTPWARLDLQGAAAPGSDAGTSRTDPHFWLDPTRLADVGDAIAERLAADDPQQAKTFTANATALRTDLEALDTEITTGLASCTNRDIVTSHEAFGYFAQRYHFTQLGITGLTPDTEPDAATIARVADFVRAHDVSTIYYETLVSPAIAETVASETGARTAVLDPVAGITSSSAAQDYLGVMRADLATLQAGQACS
jgi:zinc transport system substrate-binding protein